jgi:predicted nucleotidyltransferase
MIHPIVANHIPEIRKLCREFGVSRLEIFGSAVTDAFDPEQSDVDFLVTYPEGYDFGLWARRLQEFERSLSDLLGRDADLVMVKALSNKWFRREAEKTRMVIFDASQISEVA